MELSRTNILESLQLSIGVPLGLNAALRHIQFDDEAFFRIINEETQTKSSDRLSDFCLDIK